MKYGIIAKKVCSVFGHSEILINEKFKSKLENIITKLIIDDNVGTFLFGGFGKFDELCYKIVTKLKSKYSYLKRIYCLYDEQHLNISKRPKYLKVDDYDEFIYYELRFKYWYTRIYYRNCEMIDRSDIVLFYVNNTQKNSGAYKTFKYAIKKKKSNINIFE